MAPPYEAPGARPVFSMGEDFITANDKRSLWLITLARWACIPFSVLGGLVCFLFARSLFGTAAGYLALLLWCFDPNILSHGALITPDIPAAAFGVLATYLFWHWLKKPDWVNAFGAGVALGLAELTKMTWILLFGLWPILWVVFGCRLRDQRPKSRVESTEQPVGKKAGRSIASCAQLALILLLGLYVWPVLPFLFVLVGRSGTPAYAGGSRTGLRKGLVVACVLWSLGSSLCSYPHNLSYFNEFAGGSKNGHKHLIHCSLDWGQDLLDVKEWFESRTDSEPFYLAYYGAFNPEIVEIAEPFRMSTARRNPSVKTLTQRFSH